MTLNEKIRDILSTRSDGASSQEIASTAGMVMDATNIAIVEAHLLTDRNFRQQTGKWWSSGDQKIQRVKTAMTDYARTSGKRIFRLSAALKDIPMAYQPTEDELKQILSQPGVPFKLLPNAMIKKVDTQ